MMGSLIHLPGSNVCRIAPKIYSTSSIHLYSRQRFFHGSRRLQLSLLDTCLSQTHSVLVTTHNTTGLPWVLALPLTALIIRGVLIGPVSAYGWHMTRKVLAIHPLGMAWAHVYKTSKAQNLLHVPKDQNPSTASVGPMTEVRKQSNKKLVELRGKFGASVSRAVALPFVNIPIWLLMSETVRRMAGAHTGLIGYLSNPFANTGEVVGMDRETTLQNVGPAVVPLEPSFGWEGALWFPDLLVPDPHLMLPFVFSAAILGSIYHQQYSNSVRGIVPGKWSKRVTKISQVIGIAAGPLTLQMPSAVLVYWISSMLVGISQQILLNKFMPYTVPRITRCRPHKRLGEIDWTPKRKK